MLGLTAIALWIWPYRWVWPYIFGHYSIVDVICVDLATRSPWVCLAESVNCGLIDKDALYVRAIAACI